MQKIIKLLLLLFGVSLLMQGFFVVFSKGYNITYVVKNNNRSFMVEEKYSANQKGKDNQYSLIIDQTFSFEIFNELNKDSKLIKEITYYENDQYKCIYPIFKNKKIKTDVICKGKTLYNYHTMKGKNVGVDQFVSSLKEYMGSQFEDQKEIVKEEKFVKIYRNNLYKGHFITLQNYKGIYNVNTVGESSIDLIHYYDHDVYEPKLSAQASKYYITSSYNGEFDFDEFYVIDMTNNSKKSIPVKETISYNSYIQGSVGKFVYLIDKNAQKQYRIDAEKRVITEIGNTTLGVQYYDEGKWTKEDIVETIKNEKRFAKKVDYQNENYNKVIKTEAGYYYLFKNVGGKVEVSKTAVNNANYITYLFTASNLENISYDKGFIYFVEDGDIKYYSDQTGVRTVASHSEMNFNKVLNYFIYIK